MRIGISHHAQEALGDIVYLQMPQVGRRIRFGEEVTEIESTKATSPLYAPVSGTIIEVNERLKDSPELINRDPYGAGWILTVEMSDPAEPERLMGSKEYQEFIKQGG